MARPLLGALARRRRSARAIGRPLENVTGILSASPVPLQLDAAAAYPAEGPYDRSGFGPGASSPMPAGDGGSPANPLGG